MSNRMIKADALVKHYKDVVAVDRVSFEVQPGQIFGFLGPNGAGKSTTISMLTTRSIPTEGRASVGGFDVATQTTQVRQIIGVALQEIGLDPVMKARELLQIQGQMFNMTARQARQRGDELLELVKLTEALDRPVGKYSGGMRRRLDLALALVHKPEILFLDEPTTGLDPASRRDVWEEVRRLNRERGMTIFLTTQYLEEADQLADTVAIINEGRIAIEGQPARLKADLGTEAITLELADADRVHTAQQTLLPHFQRMQQDRHLLHVYLPEAARSIPDVVGYLEAVGIKPVSLTLTQPTLDDVFLKFTGQRFQQSQPPAVA